MKRMTRAENIDYWFKSHEATHSTLKDEDGREVEMLIWGEKDTRVCRVYYMRYGNVLVVLGDLGEAIYQWSGKLDLRWISRCSLDYFAGKCQASEEGRRYEVWDENAAREWIRQHADSAAEDYEYGLSAEEEASIHDEATKRLTEELQEAGAETALADPKLWDEFVGNHKQHFGDQGTWLSSETEGQFKLEDIVCELIMEGDYRKEAFKERWLKKFDEALGYSALESEHAYLVWLGENGEGIFGEGWWELELPGRELSIRCEGHLVGLKKAFAWLDEQKGGADGDEAKEEAPEEEAAQEA